MLFFWFHVEIVREQTEVARKLLDNVMEFEDDENEDEEFDFLSSDSGENKRLSDLDDAKSETYSSHESTTSDCSETATRSTRTRTPIKTNLIKSKKSSENYKTKRVTFNQKVEVLEFF